MPVVKYPGLNPTVPLGAPDVTWSRLAVRLASTPPGNFTVVSRGMRTPIAMSPMRIGVRVVTITTVARSEKMNETHKTTKTAADSPMIVKAPSEPILARSSLD
jgi:hypothetical protein